MEIPVFNMRTSSLLSGERLPVTIGTGRSGRSARRGRAPRRHAGRMVPDLVGLAFSVAGAARNMG
jgi:hypothetical protein